MTATLRDVSTESGATPVAESEVKPQNETNESFQRFELIDRINNRSEMNMVIRLQSQAAIRFYEVGLVNQGFVVNSSTGSGNAWTIVFSRGELDATVVITPQGEFSQVGVTVNQT